MDIQKRLFRRPVRTVLWQILLIAMSLLIGVSSVLIYASQQLTTVLDAHHTTIATQQLNIRKVGPGERVSLNWVIVFRHPTRFA